MSRIKTGKYLHYKGGHYEVIGEAVHSESREEMVVYKSLYDSPGFPKGSIWVRPKKMFLEIIKVKGKEVPRFKLVLD